MKLQVLVDNNTFIDCYYLGEPGASYYIEDGSAKILFDTGYSNIFIKNAQDMGIDLGEMCIRDRCSGKGRTAHRRVQGYDGGPPGTGRGEQVPAAGI